MNTARCAVVNTGPGRLNRVVFGGGTNLSILSAAELNRAEGILLLGNGDLVTIGVPSVATAHGGFGPYPQVVAGS